MTAPNTMAVRGVQIGQARKVAIQGRPILTAIHKQAVLGSVQVKALGLEGDEQADLSVHGGLEKAIYAYPAEHYTFWMQTQKDAGVQTLDNTLPWGSMGENLTLNGLLERDVWVGDVLRLPHCVLRVEQPREPCFKFNAAMGFSTAVKHMAVSGYCGFYLSVDVPGRVAPGDAVELIPGPRRVSIGERFKAKMFKHLR